MTALLPQPKQTTSKLVANTTPTLNPLSRGLVPYTLSKHGQAAATRREQRKKLTQQCKRAQHPTCQDASDSDKEEEEEEEEEVPVSFFSHLDTSHLASSTPSGSSDGGVVCGYGVGRGIVEVAPSAPKPFILETAGEEMEAKTSYDLIVGGEGPVDQPHPSPPQPVALHGADPGLAMDDYAVSHCTWMTMQ